MRKPKTKIADGDRWYEEEIVLMPSMLSASVKFAFDGSPQKPIRTGKYERIGLRWMTRDKQGNIVPRQ